jgi:APA family basic amino acid/polyamine antiporter
LIQDLPRKLSLIDAISIVTGVIIGAGIFLVPSDVARNLPSTPLIAAVWVAAGILTFFGALAFAEMGAAMPSTGGQYIFLREAFGPLWAFLCGWTFLLVSMTASMAWLAVSFCRYLGYFVPLDPWHAKTVAVSLVFALTFVNYRGVVLGAWVQKIFTAAKILGILAIVAAAFLAPARDRMAEAAPAVPIRLADFGIAMIACLLAYDGWVNMSFVAGEIREPRKNVLRALLTGVGLAMLLYLSANAAYLRILSPLELASTERVGATVAERTMGSMGAAFLAGVILLSVIGALNGRSMTQARVYFAQARDGLFFEKFGEIHPKYRTPAFSLWVQAAWAAVLIVTGTYEYLIDYALFAIWLFYGISVAGLFVLRSKFPDLDRPYRMWGYPVTPALFVLAAGWFVVNTAIERPVPSLTALSLIALGFPAYWYWASRRA